MLRKDDYRVLAASDGKEALGLWDREYAGIDVFVLDVIMPPIGANGLLRN